MKIARNIEEELDFCLLGQITRCADCPADCRFAGSGLCIPPAAPPATVGAMRAELASYRQD